MRIIDSLNLEIPINHQSVLDYAGSIFPEIKEIRLEYIKNKDDILVKVLWGKDYDCSYLAEPNTFGVRCGVRMAKIMFDTITKKEKG